MEYSAARVTVTVTHTWQPGIKILAQQIYFCVLFKFATAAPGCEVPGGREQLAAANHNLIRFSTKLKVMVDLQSVPGYQLLQAGETQTRRGE